MKFKNVFKALEYLWERSDLAWVPQKKIAYNYKPQDKYNYFLKVGFDEHGDPNFYRKKFTFDNEWEIVDNLISIITIGENFRKVD